MIAAHVAAGNRDHGRAAPTSAPDGLRVEVRSHLELDPAERAAVEAIIDDRPSVGVFASTAWLSGFFDDPPAETQLSLLLFRHDTTLRGFVPIAVGTAMGHAKVTLLGGGRGSDRIDIMAAPDAYPACADAFLAWLAASFGRTGFALELRDVPADSPLWGAVHRAGLTHSSAVTMMLHEIQPLPYLSLNGGPGASPPPDSLDKHRRWLAKRGDIQVELLQEPDAALAAFDTLVSFLRDRWAQDGGSALDEAARVAFHRRVIPRLLAEGRLRMMRISADGRPIGVYYGLAGGTWWGYYLAGYDRTWAGRIHLGRILLATAIEEAARQGASEFDFLKGAEPVKYLWPVRERTTVDADIASHHSTVQLTRAVRSAREVAAALVKSARGWRTA